MSDTQRLQPVVIVICESRLSQDGRAQRFAQALRQAGFFVVGAGFSNNSDDQRNVVGFDHVVLLPFTYKGPLFRYYLAASLVPGALFRTFARVSYWSVRRRRRLLTAIRRDLALRGEKPSLVIAKHWSAALIAESIADEHHALLVYDVNEVSFAEHEQNWKWRLLARPMIRAIEKIILSKAKLVTTVGDAVGQAFANQHGLANQPMTVRNIPDVKALSPSQVNATLCFVYVGLAHPVRQLETLIRSVLLWDTGRRLVLQLTGNEAYITSLRRLVTDSGLNDRVKIREPVANKDVVKSLTDMDVGLVMTPPISRQLKFAEPNKLFQCLLAGLPIVAVASTRVAEIVLRYQCGVVVEVYDEASIAASVNALDAGQIDTLHGGVRAAQKDLKWADERERLVAAIRSI